MNKTKICIKCKKELDVSCFYKLSGCKNKLNNKCKECIKAEQRQYRKDNSKKIAKQRKKHRKNNPRKVAEQQRKSYINNIEKRKKDRKKHYRNNAKYIAGQHRQTRRCVVKFDSYCRQLELFEKIRQCPENFKLLEVKCTYCGKWMLPSSIQVVNRIRAFNGHMLGELRFYCSENCKQACPIYRQKKYPKGFKKATSREVVPLLRQIVLKRDNYECQKCGATTETAQLHVHHIISYAQNKMQANDPDSCITFCKSCHKEIHSQEGCKYSDLKCK